MNHVTSDAVGLRRFASFLLAVALVGWFLPLAKAADADGPSREIAVDGPVVATVHASGFQVYTCVTDATGALAWKKSRARTGKSTFR